MIIRIRILIIIITIIIIIKIITIIMKIIITTILIIVKIAETPHLASSNHGSGPITSKFLWLRFQNAELVSVNDNTKCY